MSFDKCEVIPAAKDHHHIAQATLFPDFEFLTDGNFKLLGSPIGSADFCAAHTRQRKSKAKDLLSAVGRLSHTQ
eukprot:51750-Karenia_brevis.AAC.1